MTNTSKSKFFKSGKLTFLLLGIGMLLGTDCFSQTKSVSGANNANNVSATVKRDPFWPVGHVPEAVRAANKKKVVVKKQAESNDWNGAMKKVVINGVSSRANNDFFAVINGQVKRVDDTISVSHGGVTYTWAVANIKPPGSVKLRRVSAL
ncbi:hypothetical protein P4B35_12855 [Pontiellaceae bacterium B12227]|nr:hypothetical protein [Pontiellaceae bacterium B12227]